MLYISPVQEDVVAAGFTLQVRQWYAGAISKKNEAAAALNGDLKEVQNTWVPNKKFDDDGAVSDRPAGPDLTKGFRTKWRYVIGYNGNKEIALYAKYEVHPGKLKLVYITSANIGLDKRIDCGDGVKPVPAMLAFIARCGLTLNLPVYLNADGANKDKLIDTYQRSGWELTGVNDGSGPEMALSVQNLQRPLTTHNPQRENVDWVFGGEGSLASYLANGAM